MNDADVKSVACAIGSENIKSMAAVLDAMPLSQLNRILDMARTLNALQGEPTRKTNK